MVHTQFDVEQEEIYEMMAAIRTDMRNRCKDKQRILFTFLFSGHGVEKDKDTNAVMLNGKSQINLKKFLQSCAFPNCLVIAILDCSREIQGPQTATKTE
jgi:hypothetical protein